MSDFENNRPPAEDTKRKHVYDGIEEYNKRLPNWWLFTLYITIAFSIGYWFYYAQSGLVEEDGPRVEAEIARIEIEKMKTGFELNDANLWAMSQQEAVKTEGKATFDSLCAACHFTSLRGKSENPAAIGPDLTDEEWINGGNPMDLYKIVNEGVLAKGMPAWGPVLGAEKNATVVAYILSHHTAP